MKYCVAPSEIPKVSHFAALVFDTVNILGDERSRTNPGHGYPAHSETKISYIAFEGLEEVNNWVEKEESNSYKQVYKIINVQPVSVEKTVKVKVMRAGAPE